MANTAYVINGYSIDLDEFGETWEVRGAAGSVVYYTRSQRLAEAFARENGFPGLTDVEYAALAAPPPDPPGLVALEAAIERTREYIRQAMRSGGVKQAIYATAWDRAHRSGLQHALNALNAEVEKAYPLAALPVPSVTITPRGAVLVDRTGHRSIWPVADLLYIARSEDSAEMARDIDDATWRVRGL